MTDAPYPADTRAKGWRFEIDLEKVKASETWLRAKRGDVRAALMMLWAESWQQTPCGSLPDDDELIGLLIDMPAAFVAKHSAILRRGWWKASDGLLYHETITARVHDMLAKRAKDARRTAERRAAKLAESQGSHDGVTRDTSVTPTGVHPESDTKHQAPSTTEAIASVGSPKARATKKCPDAFQASPEMRRWAAKEVPDIDIDRETDSFRDYTFATTCIDWPGRWRNWMRKASSHVGKGSETAYQRSMRERAAEMHPSIARKAPSANPMDVLDGIAKLQLAR